MFMHALDFPYYVYLPVYSQYLHTVDRFGVSIYLFIETVILFEL